MKIEIQAIILKAIESHFAPIFEELASKITEEAFARIYDMATEEAREQYNEQLDKVWQGLHGLKDSLESAQYEVESAIEATDDIMNEVCT